MNSLYLLIAILIPVVCGLLALRIRFRSSHSLHIYIECVAIVTTLVVWFLLLHVSGSDVILYEFTPRFTIQIGLDRLGKLYAGMVSLMWPIVLLYTFSYMEHDSRQPSFLGFYILTYGATLGVCFSGNLLTMFIFFEMLSFSTLPLVAHYQDHESMHAARVYAAYLFGGATLGLASVIVVTIYGRTGHFIYGGDLGGVQVEGWVRFIFLLGFFGLGVKAAIFPMHKWLPAASVAPAPVTALLHAVAVVNTGVFAVIRLTYYAIGPAHLRGSWAQTVAILFASFTLVYAAVIALRERHVKRRLAYSTVSNLSYMLFGVMLLSPQGLAAGTAHLVFHSVTKITLFLCIGSFMHHTGKEYLSDVNGAAKHMPWTFAFYTISALSLLGVPLLCGFVSKWRLLLAGAEERTVPAYIGLGALIIAAMLCAVYGLAVSVRAYFPFKGTDQFAGIAKSDEGGWRMLVPLSVFTASQIFFGLFPGPILDYISKITLGM